MSVLDVAFDADVTETEAPKPRGAMPGISQIKSVSVSYALDIAEADGAWSACDTLTGIFGSGATEHEALRDLLAALTEHRDVLERQPALSDDLAAQLAYLRLLDV